MFGWGGRVMSNGESRYEIYVSMCVCGGGGGMLRKWGEQVCVWGGGAF